MRCKYCNSQDIKPYKGFFGYRADICHSCGAFKENGDWKACNDWSYFVAYHRQLKPAKALPERIRVTKSKSLCLQMFGRCKRIEKEKTDDNC